MMTNKDVNESIERILQDDAKECFKVPRKQQLMYLIGLHKDISRGMLLSVQDMRNSELHNMKDIYMSESFAYWHVANLYINELMMDRVHRDYQEVRELKYTVIN